MYLLTTGFAKPDVENAYAVRFRRHRKVTTTKTRRIPARDETDYSGFIIARAWKGKSIRIAVLQKLNC